MKKVLLSVAVLATLSTSGMAQDFVGENENIIIRIGADIEGNSKDLTLVPSTTNKYTGTEQDMAYEIGFGIEENIENYNFGTRKMLTFYNDGDAVIHNGGLLTNVSNLGLEATYEVFYKVNKFFKPYAGAGIGINQQKINLDARGGVMPDVTYDRDTTKYTPTVQAVIGVTGQFGAGFGYYVNAKYRFADEKTTSIPFKEGGGAAVSTKIVEVDGVSGEQFMVGLSYKF